MWSSVVGQPDDENENKIGRRGIENSPRSRSKHSVTLLNNHLYLLGGRNGNIALKDFWKYDLINNKWEIVDAIGDCPPSLQEHTAVSYQQKMYVFGGEMGFSAGNETPLWVYQSKTNRWQKKKGCKGSSTPKGRRGHTALLHRGSILIYGGYCDLKGSSNELWIFHLETESWHLLVSDRHDPCARHKHSAVLHDDTMWVYGGMNNLHECSDLWKFNTVNKKWSNVKCKSNPGPLHSHSACKLPNSMLLFGGEHDGQLSNQLWRFHFGSECWERIYTDAFSPQPLSECCAIVLSDWLLESTNETRPTENNGKLLGTPTSYIIDYRSPMDPSHHSNVFGSREHNRTLPRRKASTPSTNKNLLRELGKLSQINLSRMATVRNGSYQALSNQNNEIEETTNDEFEEVRVKSSRCSLLTPTEASKLVYLEDETAPEELASVVMRNNRANSNVKFRRSYPTSAQSVRFANPLVTPEEAYYEITSDYASCENMKPNQYYNASTPNSYNNPNYFALGKFPARDKSHMEEFSKMRSPSDSFEDDSGVYEMKEIRPMPPKSLALRSAIGMNLASKKIRATSASRMSECRTPCSVVEMDNYCSRSSIYMTGSTFYVYILGGKEKNSVTVFRKPISIWKLTLPNNIIF